MRVIEFSDGIKLNNTIVTVGKFDGIHKGHEKLLDTMADNANGRKKVVLTFADAPDNYLKHESGKTIFTEGEKRMLCDRLGVDVYMSMPLTEEFLGMSPDEFVTKVLKEKVGATEIVCGPDFRFGKEAKGDIWFLKENQVKYNLGVTVIDKEKYHDNDISSTEIREKILEGKIEEVNEMLDHPYTITGKVERGKSLGRRIELPTANITPEENKLLPPNGVYRTVVVSKHMSYPAITNIGVNPTVEDTDEIRVESHILNFKDDLYGEILDVRFYEFIRPEKKFESVDELKEQIMKDMSQLLKQ